MNTIRAVLLAGGRSSRMGSRKEWLVLRKEPFVVSIARALLDASTSVVVVADPNSSVPPLPGDASVVRDCEPCRRPLYGFATGLVSLEPARAVYLSSCDVPLLQASFVRLVLDRLGSHDVAVPVVAGVPQPLAAAYRAESLLKRINCLLDAGRKSVMSLLDGADVREINEDELREADPDLDSLRNINTPDEYAALLREYG